MNLTDTHCHLNLDHYQDDLKGVLSRAQAGGVNRILVPALDLASSREILTLVENDPILYAAIGVHPNSGSLWESDSLAVLDLLADHPKVAAIGEIGLDYYRDRTPRDLQKEILKAQLNLARSKSLPVVLHVRNTSEEDRSCIEDLLNILESWGVSGSISLDQGRIPPGVIHSFSGNLAESKRALQIGFYIGITGPVTYKNADSLREVVHETDITRLLIETDGPFLSPHPHRGNRNEPAHVRYIVDKISEIKGMSPGIIADQTTANAASLFMWEQEFD